jgi:hypothetical protein
MNVISEEMEVRVRPPRIAVVISSHTTPVEYLRVIEFLSLVRGGKFARFIYADMETRDFVPFLQSEGKNFQPELIIGAGEQDRSILRFVCEHSRPQRLDLFANIEKNFEEHQIGGLCPWQEVVLKESKKQPDLKRDNVCLLDIKANTDFELLVATTYGIVPNDISKVIQYKLQTEYEEISVNNAKELYALSTLMAPRVSWLNFLNKESGLLYSAWHPPTIVMVEDQQPLRSLALFWNRSKHIAPGGRDESILFFRECDVEDDDTVKSVCNTLAISNISSDFCQIVNAGPDTAAAQRLAQRLRPRLRKARNRTYHVDVEKNVVEPYTYCHEINQNAMISRDGVIVSVPKLEPLYGPISSLGRWFLDLVKTRQTGRYPFEFALPKDADLLELLNVPSGRFVVFRRLMSFSKECLSISLSASDRSSITRFELPSERELFRVIFHRASWSLIGDEKNTYCSRILDLFHGLSDTAIALSGTGWKIIDALRAKPLTDPELREKAKLGKHRNNLPIPELAGVVRDHQNGLYRELFESRVRRELTNSLSSTAPAGHILEYLVRRKVIFRKWRLDKCPGCKQEHWVTYLDIQNPLHCPGCGTYIPYRDRVLLGYELNPLVSLAVAEGVQPVVLTARFLRNLTLDGFLMYPGAKLRKGSAETDIDICAIGDQTLIAGECKTLKKSKKDGKVLWGDILSQLTRSIQVAKACEFRVFFVSSLTEEYPKDFKDKVIELAGASIKTLFLTRNDLEHGKREFTDAEGHKRTLTLNWLLKPPKPFRRRKDKRKTRTMDF